MTPLNVFVIDHSATIGRVFLTVLVVMGVVAYMAQWNMLIFAIWWICSFIVGSALLLIAEALATRNLLPNPFKKN